MCLITFEFLKKLYNEYNNYHLIENKKKDKNTQTEPIIYDDYDYDIIKFNEHYIIDIKK